MGGRVLEFRADNVFNAGKNEGRKEERKEWQEKDKEWQMERQKMQIEIEKLRMQMKATNAMPGLAT